MSLKKIWTHKYGLTLCIIILLFLSFVSVSYFISDVKRGEREIAANNLVVTSNNGAAMIRSTFASYLTQLRTLAKTIEQYDNFKSSEVVSLMKNLSSLNNYDRLAIVFPDGDCYTSEGRIVDVSQMATLENVTRDIESISNVYKAVEDARRIISLAVPLRNKDGDICASLRLSLRTDAIDKEISLSPFDSEGYYHLIDIDGNYIADTTNDNALLMNDNFFVALDKLNFDDGYTAQQIKDVFKNGSSTFSRYSFGWNDRYAYCQRVGINDWVLMTIVPKQVVSKSEQRNILLAITMTVQLGVILSIAFVYIYLVQRKSRKMAQLNDRCFRALSDQTGKVILEWNFSTNKLTTTGKFRELFGRDMATVSTQDDALTTSMVHPDDAPIFTAVFTDIYNGVSFENVKFRIMHSDGSYHWCLLAGVIVSDWRGKPYRAIGSLEDINELVMRQEALKHKAETDLLSGLYNKATTEYLINDVLAGGDGKAGNCSLLIADIDNFKNVNDTLGHQAGDNVLKRVAELLIPFVRKTDILGRIGGDEFFIFFRGFDNESDVRKKAESICRMFKASCSDAETKCNISLSVGISFFPRDAQTFEDLYKQADIALYRTKRSGKNGYIVYNTSFGTEIDQSRTAIESGNTTHKQ